VWGQHDAGWLAFYGTFRQFGLDAPARLAGLMDVARSAGWWWPLAGAVVLTDRPQTLLRDSDWRLHCATGPALQYRDGWGIHAWHGLRVPADLVEGDGWSTDRILREPNQELRRAAIERMGWAEFAVAAGLRQVGDAAPDPGNPGHELRLYDLPAQIFNEEVRVLTVVNGTVERDGTRRKFGLTCPANIQDPLSAAAWGYGISAEQYVTLARRT
jgi:hypothetical protein